MGKGTGHNYYQFQRIYAKKGLKLRRGANGFAYVNYHPRAGYVEIMLDEDNGYLSLFKEPRESEEDFVCRAVMAFNRKEFDH